jgi:hypothetical protein
MQDIFPLEKLNLDFHLFSFRRGSPDPRTKEQSLALGSVQQPIDIAEDCREKRFTSFHPLHRWKFQQQCRNLLKKSHRSMIMEKGSPPFSCLYNSGSSRCHGKPTHYNIYPRIHVYLDRRQSLR